MSKAPKITYAAVSEVCHEIQGRGERPSVRKIHQRLGGSFTTISEFHQRWQEEHVLARRTDTDLSEPFRQAVLAEFTRVTEDIKLKLEEQLTIERTQLRETHELLTEHELKIEQLLLEHSEYKKLSEEKHLRLEKELFAAKTLGDEHAKREKDLQKQVSDLRDRLHEAELKAAVSDTQSKELEKQNRRLEQELKDWKERKVKA